MYSMPQEIEVWYIIPAIRRELAGILTQKHNLKQKDVAEILGTTEAAISQYLHKKRGRELKFPKKMQKYFKDAAKAITENHSKAVSEIIKLLNMVKKQGLECSICKKYNKGILPLCACKPEKEVRK